MSAGAIQKGQRVLLLAFAPPSPVMTEIDSKAETAAKIMPGLGLVVKDAQDQRDLKASLDIQQYLPPWKPASLFLSSFTIQVSLLGQPGKLIHASDTNLPAATWSKLNRAADVNDWMSRYYVQLPEHMVGRNYSAFLELDDAVVLEINLAYGLETEGDGVYAPTLSAVTKLLRANTMRQLWRHENQISEKGAARILYDFKVKPGDLIYAWNRLMPMLGALIVDDLRKGLQTAGVPISPAGPSFGLSFSTASASFLPSGGGWAPAAATPAAPAAPEALPPLPPFTPKPSTP